MARRVKKVSQPRFKVTLTQRDGDALLRLVRRERKIRGVPDRELGGATLLAEFAMPLVHARNAELDALEADGVEPSPERRVGPERRHPELASLSS